MIKKLFYGWWIVLACSFIGLFVGGIVAFGCTAFFEPLIKEFGWNYTQISLATSLRGVEMGIFAPFIGFLVDRFGSKKLIIYGIITTGFGFILLSFAKSLLMFYASFLLLAFGSGSCMGVVLMTTVAKWFDKNVGKAFSVVACAFGAGGLTVPLIVWLIDVFHWRTALIILGVGIWILGIPLALFIRDKPEQYGYFPDGESLPPVKNKGESSEIGFKEGFKQRAFLYLNIVELIRHIIISAVVLHVMPSLSSMGVSRSTAGMVAASLPLVSIVGRVGFGWFGDVFDKRHMMAVALGLIGTGLLAFCYVQQGWLLLIFILPFSSGWGGTMVLTRSMLREYFGRDSFGKMLGIIMGLGSIGGIIGPTLAGWVFDTLGSYLVTWLIFCGLSALSIGLILRIKPLMKIDA